MRASLIRIASLLGVGLVLTGCDVTDQQEIRQWMADTRRDMRPVVQPIPEPRKFEPFIYGQQGAVDPYNTAKMDVALQKLAAKSSSGLRPNMDRRREPLEAFPLDALAMVGAIRKSDALVALIKMDKAIYQVRVGNYMGQNFGLVTKITETELTLKEIVQDATGDWVERFSTMQLQESKK